MEKPTHYVAVPEISSDRTAIFGIGATPSEALSDAVQWTGDDTEGLVALPCTPELRAEIEKRGAPKSWGELFDGTQCTDQEAEQGI